MTIVEALGGVGGKQTIVEALGGVGGKQTISELVKDGTGGKYDDIVKVIFAKTISGKEFSDNVSLIVHDQEAATYKLVFELGESIIDNFTRRTTIKAELSNGGMYISGPATSGTYDEEFGSGFIGKICIENNKLLIETYPMSQAECEQTKQVIAAHNGNIVAAIALLEFDSSIYPIIT